MKTDKTPLPLLLLAALVLTWAPAVSLSAQEYVIGARDVLKVTVWVEAGLPVPVALVNHS